VEIVKYLENSQIVQQFSVLDYKVFTGGLYIKLKAILKGGSVLHIKEYSDSESRKYSYNWQAPDGKLILRWDNSPHYKHLKTFPHHKHVDGGISESYSIVIEDVLEEIQNLL